MKTATCKLPVLLVHFAFCILHFAFCSSACAYEPPVVGRPAEHFYNAVGERVRVLMSAQPTDVRVEEETVLTVRIVGADNPEDIRRPDLRTLPEFTSRFHIDDLDDGTDADAAKGERKFRYRLRPKKEGAIEIPLLLFHYWQPRLRYFASTASEETVGLNVRARETPPETSGPLVAPEFLFDVAPTEVLLAKSSHSQGYGWAMLLLIAPALPCLLWHLWWRSLYPDAAKLARYRHNRAVRAALDRILTANGKADATAAGVISNAVRGYLHDRWAMPAKATTPIEVTAFLSQIALPAEVVATTKVFFETCAAIQFGLSGAGSDSLAFDAEQVIRKLENAGAAVKHVSRGGHLPSVLGRLLAISVALGLAADSLADDPEAVAQFTAKQAADYFRAGVDARNDQQNARRLFASAARSYAATRNTLQCDEVLRARNEGHAWVLAGDLPRAIIAYRYGLLEDSGDPELNRALEYARSQIVYANPADRSRLAPTRDSLARVWHFLHNWGMGLVGTLSVLGWAGLTRWRMVRTQRHLWFGALALGSAMVLLPLLAFESDRRIQAKTVQFAVIKQSAILRTGDGPSFPARHESPLPIGVEVTVHRYGSGWLQVELADGTLGWLPRDQALLKPFSETFSRYPNLD